MMPLLNNFVWQAFCKIDSGRQGVITLGEMRKFYNANKHPRVQSSENDVIYSISFHSKISQQTRFGCRHAASKKERKLQKCLSNGLRVIFNNNSVVLFVFLSFHSLVHLKFELNRESGILYNCRVRLVLKKQKWPREDQLLLTWNNMKIF